MRHRPPVSAIAWVPGGGRPRELAAALGGEARAFFDLRIVRRPLVPLRYLLSGARMAGYLLRARPRAVIVQVPPIPAALIAYAYGKLAEVPVVIDSHPAAFGIEGTRVDVALRPLLARLARDVSGCIVTTDELGDQVRRWGGRPIVVHEAPPEWMDDGPTPDPEPDTVLFVCTFAPDEPVEEVIAAARRVRDVRFKVTGDLRKLRPEIQRTTPDNVEWLGYLKGKRYPDALRRAAVTITLTQRRESVPRSAYEAVYAGRPLVTSDWPHMRELFPQAVLVENRSRSIAEGVRHALDSAEELEASADQAHDVQLRRWELQVQALRGAIDFNRPQLGRQRPEAVVTASESNGGYGR